MKKNILLFITLISANVFSQTNIKTGNMSSCYTWARLADQYTTINNLTVLHGTQVTMDVADVHGSTINLNDNTTLFLNSNLFTFDGKPNVNIECGTIYGYDNGSGKYTYSTPANNCARVSDVDIFTTMSRNIIFGPIKTTGNYRFDQAKITFLNCSFQYTTDWNLRIRILRQGIIVLGDQHVTIDFNRGNIQGASTPQTTNALTACSTSGTGMRYVESFSWDFTNSLNAVMGNIFLEEGDRIVIEASLIDNRRPDTWESSYLLVDARMTQQ